MHSTAEDGRAESWQEKMPEGIRCVECGAKTFIPGYAEATS
jgi:hypothetical protein